MTAAMTDTETLVRRNIADGGVFVLAHATAQMKRRGVALAAVLASVATGETIEHYPHDDEGPAILMLQWDASQPLHVVWRIEAATAGPAVLVTVYRPDAKHWGCDFRRRRAPGA
jgi:Domain of unknown function (DUF4258)